MKLEDLIDSVEGLGVCVSVSKPDREYRLFVTAPQELAPWLSVSIAGLKWAIRAVLKAVLLGYELARRQTP
jgi:hypothetical protein